MAASTETARKDADKPVPKVKKVTVQGIKVDVDPKIMAELDVMEALDESKTGENPFAIIRVFKAVFGEEKYKEIAAHLKEEHGAARFEDMNEFFTDALKKASPNS